MGREVLRHYWVWIILLSFVGLSALACIYACYRGTRKYRKARAREKIFRREYPLHAVVKDGDLIRLKKDSVDDVEGQDFGVRCAEKDREGFIPLSYACLLGDSEKTLEICTLLHENTPHDIYDGKNLNRDQMCLHAKSDKVKKWAKKQGRKYGIYKLNKPIRPIYKSKTCEVFLASKDVDVAATKTTKEVTMALKFLRNKKNLETEKTSRKLLEKTSTTHVLSKCEYHEMEILEKPTAPTWWDGGENKPGKEYCIAMPAADRSLCDVISAEFIAGKDFHQVKIAARHIALGLKAMHDSKLIHCDLKPRNILRTGSTWKLIDFDAAAEENSPLDCSCKHSSGYVPPEMARLLFADGRQVKESNTETETKTDTNTRTSQRNGKTITASCVFDIWSFGVVLYQLCTGESLFTLDLNSDNIIKEEEKSTLMSWSSLQDENFLSKIFRASSDHTSTPVIAESTRKDVQDLIQWCLEGKPEDRPQSMDEILDHCFMKDDRKLGFRSPKDKKTKGFYLSHYPKNAGAAVEELMSCAQKMIDELHLSSSECQFQLKVSPNQMLATSGKQRMKADIRSCECFVLVLSNGVFSHKCCREEINEARRLGKTFLLVNLTHPSAAAPLFDNYRDQCREFYQNEEDVMAIFGATLVPFHSSSDFNVVTAHLLFSYAGYLASQSRSRKAANKWMLHHSRLKSVAQKREVVSIFRQHSLSRTKSGIAKILIIGRGVYLDSLKSCLKDVTSNEIEIETIDDVRSKVSADNMTPDELSHDAIRCATSCIFYATEESFKDDLSLELLSMCEKPKNVVIVRECDERQGGMSEEDIRLDASNEFKHGHSRLACVNIFGHASPGIGWREMVPFYFIKDFRIAAAQKVLSLLRNYGSRAPLYLHEQLKDGIIPKPENKYNAPGGGYHFFISKHEALSKDFSINVATALREVGFKVWLSQSEQANGNTANIEGMQKGVRDSDMLLVIMTPGIFHADRVHVWQTEVQHAIEVYNKPVVMIRGSGKDPKTGNKISLGRKTSTGCGHSAECCENVDEKFQFIARALVAALEVGSWANAKFDREGKIKWLLNEYMNRQNRRDALQRRLADEKLFGKCDGAMVAEPNLVVASSVTALWYEKNTSPDSKKSSTDGCLRGDLDLVTGTTTTSLTIEI